MRTFKFVAVKPLTKHAVEAVATTSGFMVSASHVSLVGSEAVADYEPLDIRTGDVVYIRGTSVKQRWAIDTLKVGSLEFILVPEVEVVAAEQCAREARPLPRPPPTSMPSAGSPRRHP